MEDVAGLDLLDVLDAERIGTSVEFWLNLQMAHDLELARQPMRPVA